MRRHELLAAAGAATAAGLAGCLGVGPCANAPDEPQRVDERIASERRITLSYEGCPTLRDPGRHYTTIQNRRASTVAVELDVDLLDGGALFRGQFLLRSDARVVVERPEPAGYTVVVQVPSLDWSERYEEHRDSYTCNERWQRVTVVDADVEAQTRATTMDCESGFL